MKRVLVTGAAGFLGQPAARQLRAANWEIIGTSRGTQPVDFPGEWISADLLEAGAAAKIAETARASHLLHLAWVTEHGKYWESAENAQWISASQQLLQAFARTGGKRAVIAGTCAEYDWTQPDPATAPPRPATTYGKAKLALHDWAVPFAQQAKISLAWGRVFFAFGPGEDARRLAPYIARQLLRGEPVLCGSGTAERDFLHVDDLATLWTALLEGEVAGDFDLGSGHGQTIRAFVEALAQIAGRPDLPRFGARPDPAGEPRRLVAHRLVPGVSKESVFPTPQTISLQRTLEWWRKHPADSR